MIYFDKLTKIYRNTKTKVQTYLYDEKQATDSVKKNILRKIIIEEINYSIRETGRSHFSQNDFGLKKAVLQDYYQSLKTIQDTSIHSRRKYDSLDDQIAWLDSLTEELKINSDRINKNLMQCQQKFITHYKITVQQEITEAPPEK